MRGHRHGCRGAVRGRLIPLGSAPGCLPARRTASPPVLALVEGRRPQAIGERTRRVATTTAVPLDATLTYQGSLEDAGLFVDGDYDFRFRLFDDPDAGMQVGPGLECLAVPVRKGLFTTQLDFGFMPFMIDEALWLEIDVRGDNGSDMDTPADGTALHYAPADFTWQAAANVRHQVVLYDDRAGEIWTSEPIAAGRIELPTEIRRRLQPGGYDWQVRVLGSGTTPGPYRSEIMPAGDAS